MTENEKMIFKAIQDSSPRMPLARAKQLAEGIVNAIESICKSWKADPLHSKVKASIDVDESVQVCSDLIYAGSVVTVVGLPQQSVSRALSNALAVAEPIKMDSFNPYSLTR